MTPTDDPSPARAPAAAAAAPAAFDLAELASVDSDWMTVNHPRTGLPTTWKIEVAGPGHPATLAIQREAQMERLAHTRRVENAQVNGRKYKAEEVDPAEEKNKIADRLARRIIGWSEVTVDGQPYPYSPANALALMTEPRWVSVYAQLVEYISADAAFIKGSAPT